ncbi:hypothetical protein SAMN04488035_2663 [Flavimobilis marinus]|uniref:Uncharacterized protein n=1 Tax=Flavimobilis marinus TaxID=285351 RepID=A0A1I2I0Y4_9MICO|nr:hypothetical protein [Flavimobilis marinus]SFF36039.1 hypothetical protein SAMN04488035_2663 [Flavimobilis marinus]
MTLTERLLHVLVAGSVVVGSAWWLLPEREPATVSPEEIERIVTTVQQGAEELRARCDLRPETCRGLEVAVPATGP